MSLGKSYKKSLEQQWNLRFKTKHPNGDSYDGVITNLKKRFVILREEIDFEFEGLIIVQKKFIKSCRDGKYEQCCNEILRTNDAMKKCSSPRWINVCETMVELLTAIKTRGHWPGIETLFDNNTDYAFYIGPITQIGDKSCHMYCYDAAGKWEKEYEIKYDEILRISLYDRYGKHFNKYMSSRQIA